MEPALEAPAQNSSSSALSTQSTSPPLPIGTAASVSTAVAIPSQPSHPKAAHVFLPAFRPRVLALSNSHKNDGKVLIKLTASASTLAAPVPPPPFSSSLLWQRHAHGSYRSYYGARRQASSRGVAAAAAAATTTTTTTTLDSHPPPPSKSTPTTDARLSLLQPNWFTNKDCLDIGTNTGKVAWEIYLLFNPRRMVGVDIDPELIRVAKEKLAWACRREGGKKGHAEKVEFRCEDFVGRREEKTREGEGRTEGEKSGPENGKGATEEEGDVAGEEGQDDERREADKGEKEKAVEESNNEEVEEEELKGAEEYDIITCLSVTKHIQLEGGDAALRRLFHRVHAQLRPGGRFILEPQAWRTYRKRKHASVESQSNYALLKLRPPFKEVLMNEVGFESVQDVGVPPEAPAGYRRPMYCFVKRREETGGGAGREGQ